MNKCLYCYQELKGTNDFHKHCAKTFFRTTEVPLLDYTLDQMSLLAKNVVERSISVPGVQAKLSMSLVNEVTNEHHNRLTVVGALGGDYIFKPPNANYPEMPENEHVTMRIAETFGINTVPSTLIRLKSGELSYLTKRIDRKLDGTKIHVLDMFQITEAFDKYRSSMERIGKALGMYASNTLLDKLYFFEITLFSFLTGNNDMHLKNFSMIKTAIGWSLTPAYDLLNVAIVNPDNTEDLALTIAGKKKKITKAHFEELGKNLGLTPKQVTGVFKRFRKHQKTASTWVKKSFLSQDMKLKYLDVLENRFDRIYGNT